jgi:hypothetical protein
MVYCQTKNPDLGKFWRALEWNMLVRVFYAHWEYVLAIGVHVFYAHLECVIAIW